ncbi:tripartite tricarboxylate transporter TctB family protein [Paraglaciecola sp. L3A3]|uniref:tripartite tricarboxylate transporter TctB family protein n=1 Tax=Paraglaciecola sp. L3A3 TaxID=2686358 RepID=UPI00131BA912|nr:tripartite tricarboxylate transporter TctB family protein [Paraglaciecola sp. L3A3]
MSDKDPNKAKDRQYDFKFVIVLLLILAYILKITLSFPMSGSYGGVDNQWYVSPALFPLILLSALFLCCSALFFSALKGNGAKNFFSLPHWFGDKNNQHTKDRWLIIALLIVYVYILIPSTDFYLATTIFVASLTSIFYLQLNNCRKWVITVNCLLVISLVSIRTILKEDPSIGILDINDLENSILYCDISTSVALLILLGWQIKDGFSSHRTKLIYTGIAVIVVPLILVMMFSFLLYVPMPVEYGKVISFLNWLIYEQLGL